MSGPTLLYSNGESNTFSFEHMNGHRNYFGVMFPLDRFSVLPYLLDPMLEPSPSLIAGNWMLNHQQAHNDSLRNVPQYYWLAPGFGVIEPGLFVGHNLMDTNLADESSRAWWTFANHTEHLIMNNTVLPGPAPGTAWRFPFF